MDTINQQPDVVFDEAGETTLAELSENVQAIAEAQAAKDAELMASLSVKRNTVSQRILAEVNEAEDEAAGIDRTPARIPMNRHDRRRQVAFYAAMLASSERQVPYVNPTIKPKSSRRRRKGSNRAH